MNTKTKVGLVTGIILIISLTIGIFSVILNKNSKIANEETQKSIKNDEQPNIAITREKEELISGDVNADLNAQENIKKIPTIREYNTQYTESNCNIPESCNPADDGYGCPELMREFLKHFENNEYTDKKFNFKIILPKNIKSFYVYGGADEPTSLFLPTVLLFSRNKGSFRNGDHSITNDLFQVKIFKTDGCNKVVLDDKEKDFCDTFVFSKKQAEKRKQWDCHMISISAIKQVGGLEMKSM